MRVDPDLIRTRAKILVEAPQPGDSLSPALESDGDFAHNNDRSSRGSEVFLCDTRDRIVPSSDYFCIITRSNNRIGCYRAIVLSILCRPLLMKTSIKKNHHLLVQENF